jgi:hypothetical protein
MIFSNDQSPWFGSPFAIRTVFAVFLSWQGLVFALYKVMAGIITYGYRNNHSTVHAMGDFNKAFFRHCGMAGNFVDPT